MGNIKNMVAHYHLPGLFEFYELYRVFLPLFREHREYFYDWCDIGSIYGAPADCLWGGGRAGFGDNTSREVLALLREYGIAVRSGAHCAPRMHEALGTVAQGAVRFSFGWFNTMEEAETAADAVRDIAL